MAPAENRNETAPQPAPGGRLMLNNLQALRAP